MSKSLFCATLCLVYSYICKIGCEMQREQRVTIKKATTELAAAKSDEKEKEQQTRRRQKLLRRMASSDVQRETQFQRAKKDSVPRGAATPLE